MIHPKAGPVNTEKSPGQRAWGLGGMFYFFYCSWPIWIALRLKSSIWALRAGMHFCTA